MSESFFPQAPDGYVMFYSECRDLICATHPEGPLMCLDEDTLTWRELDEQEDPEHHAQDPSTC